MNMYSCADVVGDFCREGSVVHQQDVEVFDVVNEELLQTIGQMESSFLIVTVTDLWHGLVASKSSSHSVVDTCILV
jgi:hypothetical protein